MPRFYELLLSLVGHVPAIRPPRVTNAVSTPLAGSKRPKRGRKSQAPPLFQGNNRLRRDIGLPPVDDRGLPL